MAGAVGLSLAIEYNRTGIFTFMVPAAMGLVILLASWVSIIPKLQLIWYLTSLTLTY